MSSRKPIKHVTGMRFVDGRPCRDRDTHQAAIHRRVQKKTVAEQSNMGNKNEALCTRDVPKAGCDVVEMATAPPTTHIEPLRTCLAARDIVAGLFRIGLGFF